MAEDLPTELLKMILEFLDPSSFIEAHLEYRPDLIFDEEGKSKSLRTDLKNASLVCRRWHHLARPLVFQHLHFCAERQQANEEPSDETLIQTVEFLTRGREFLSEVVESVTIIVVPSSATKSCVITKNHVFAYERVDNDGHWLMDPVESRRWFDFDQKGHKPYDPLEKLWEALIDLHPHRFTIVGSGHTLETTLTGNPVYDFDSPAFESTRFRLLSLSHPEAKPSLNSTDDAATIEEHANDDRTVEEHSDDDVMAEELSDSDTIVEKRDSDDAATPLETLLKAFWWTKVLFNEGSRMSEPDSEDEGSFLALLKSLELTRYSIDFALEGVDTIIYISELAGFEDAFEFTSLLLWQYTMKTFRFRMLPPDLDLSKVDQDKTLTAGHRRAIGSHCHEQLRALREPGFQLAKATWTRWAEDENHAFVNYEFPDLAREQRTWTAFVTLIEGVAGRRFRVTGPGRFSQPEPQR